VAGRGGERARERALFTAEAVNDHLRVLSSARGLDVESGGPHQVKPWFQGKLDFAPDVPEPPGLTLQGASLGYWRDRRAAVVVYKLRLHVVTLLQVRAEGLRWPSGSREVSEAADRRFHVFFWRAGDVGYALVSDADPAEVGSIARRLAGT
jgi:anti-sigma factor RsiW